MRVRVTCVQMGWCIQTSRRDMPTKSSLLQTLLAVCVRSHQCVQDCHCLRLTALVADAAVPLGADHHVFVAHSGHGRGHPLDGIFPEQDRQNGLDLDKSEVLPHARMHSASKAQIGVGGLVLFARRGKAVGIERIRIGEGRLLPHAHRGADAHVVALGDGVRFPGNVDLDVSLGFAQDHDEGGTHAQGLPHAVVQILHLL